MPNKSAPWSSRSLARAAFFRIAIVVAAMTGLAGMPASADEGGVSFWLPGQMGSFSAVPTDPGLSMPVVYIHSSVSAGADKAFPRAGRITAGVDGTADLVVAFPTYTLSSPVAGGQASFGVGVGGGHMKVSVNATLTGPNGNTITGTESDSIDGFADLYPSAMLKWHDGVHNTMVYAMAGVPVGSYSVGRLANLGTNHWSIDGGGGYTYLDPKKGHEFTAVAGFTYNGENKDTRYRNGNDFHIDLSASKFLSPNLHVGVSGYHYQQLSGDSGTGATLGDFKSRITGAGPQAGYFFEAAGRKYYANVKAFYEWNAENRPGGWSVWLSVAIPLGEGTR
jgi:hypothetical protein